MSKTKLGSNYDLIIVGGGAMGLATAYYALPEVSSILVVDRFGYSDPSADRLNSNSAGATRQFRVQYSEEYMATMALNTMPLWTELQTHTTDTLVSDVGSVWFGDADASSSEGQINESMATMDKLGIPYTPLTAQEIMDNYGFGNLDPSWTGFFQGDGGTINVDGCFKLYYDACVASGKVDFLGTAVTSILPLPSEVHVNTDAGMFIGSKIVIAAGPYTNDLTAPLGVELDIVIWQMVSCYFKKLHPDVDFPSWYSFESARDWYDPGVYYGFEEMSYDHPGFIRACPAYAMDLLRHPDERTDRPNSLDLQMTSQWVAKHMPGLDPEPRFKSFCMAALPADPDQKMFLDFAPVPIGSSNVVIFSSGWCFKFNPLIGTICADLAIKGSTTYDISQFTIPQTGFRKMDLAAAKSLKPRRFIY